jgi:hypothetical protein
MTFKDWDHQSNQKNSLYLFMQDGSEVKNASASWINMGSMYEPPIFFQLPKDLIISNFLNEVEAKDDGLLGYFGRIETNLKMLKQADLKLIRNVVEIGPGWGGLRAYSETLNIDHYTCIEPISETRKILEYNFNILEHLGSKVEAKIFSDHHKAIKNLKKNPYPTLFYAANVLSEVSEDYLTKYISFLEDAMQQNDILIIEDWFRKERKSQLINLTCSKFTLFAFKVNMKHFHITAVFKTGKSNLSFQILSKIKFNLYLKLIFPIYIYKSILHRNSLKTLSIKLVKMMTKERS